MDNIQNKINEIVGTYADNATGAKVLQMKLEMLCNHVIFECAKTVEDDLPHPDMVTPEEIALTLKNITSLNTLLK